MVILFWRYNLSARCYRYNKTTKYTSSFCSKLENWWWGHDLSPPTVWKGWASLTLRREQHCIVFIWRVPLNLLLVYLNIGWYLFNALILILLILQLLVCLGNCFKSNPLPQPYFSSTLGFWMYMHFFLIVFFFYCCFTFIYHCPCCDDCFNHDIRWKDSLLPIGPSRMNKWMSSLHKNSDARTQS